MNELLDALAIRGAVARAATALGIWVFFGAAMFALAALQAVAEHRFDVGFVGTVTSVALVWVLWSYWHSVLFPRHRRRYLAMKQHPYRAAFVVDLIPGLSISFAQMLRPWWNGHNLREGRLLPADPETALQAIAVLSGWLLLGAAILLFARAWRTLGAWRVGFVPEYRDHEKFSPLRTGPYRWVRHPLFWSGVGASCALALIFLSPVGAAVAAVNVGYGLVYNHLEDRRLNSIFGERYASYAHEVPRIVPDVTVRRTYRT